MLIEESSCEEIPKDLEELVMPVLLRSSKCAVSEHDLIVCVLCALMKECDLQLHVPDTESKIGENLNTVISNLWKNNSTKHYNISFVLGHFIKNKCRFIGIPIKDTLIVNVVISGIPNQCYSICICCNDYVTVEKINNNCVASIFTNLKHLSHKFKNSVAHPVRSAILNEEGILNASLLGLSYELQLKILNYLNVKEIGYMAQTCSYFNYLSKDQRLWKQIAYNTLTRREIELAEGGLADGRINWKLGCKNALKRRSSNCDLVDTVDFRPFLSRNSHLDLNFYWLD